MFIFKQVYLKLLCALFIYTCFFIFTSNCFKCGRYGFVCITPQYFKPCGEMARNIHENVIYKCPKNSHCNENNYHVCNEETEKKVHSMFNQNKYSKPVLHDNRRLSSLIIGTEIGNTVVRKPMNMTGFTAKLLQQSISNQLLLQHKSKKRKNRS